MVSRAVVNIVTDSYKRQNLQISLLAGEVAADVERFQNYGHTSVPPVNSEAIVLSVGGKRQHLVAIAVEDKETRLHDLAIGDSALYHMDGHYVLLTKNGDNLKALIVCDEIEVIAQTALFDVLQTQFKGNVDILGDVTIKKNLTTSGVSSASDHQSNKISGKSHVHRCPQCNVATTPPIEG